MIARQEYGTCCPTFGREIEGKEMIAKQDDNNSRGGSRGDSRGGSLLMEHSLVDGNHDNCRRLFMDATTPMEDGMNNLINSASIGDVPVMCQRGGQRRR